MGFDHKNNAAPEGRPGPSGVREKKGGNRLMITEQIQTREGSWWPVIDCHVHPKASEQELIQDLDKAGITHAVILATETDPEDVDRPEIRTWLVETYGQSELRYELPLELVIQLVRESQRSDTHVDNDKVAEWARKFPDRLIPFCSVNLCKPPEMVEKTLEETLKLRGRGFKLLPYSQFFDPSENENVELLMEHCRRHQLPILCHTGCAAGVFEDPTFSRNSQPMLWDEVLDRYPDVPLILAHFGAYSANYPGIWMGQAVELMKRHENVYADLAAVSRLLENEVLCRWVREEVGFGRVLFGSDYPMPRFVPGGSLKDIIEIIRELKHLTEKEKRGILGENAGKLLGLL